LDDVPRPAHGGCWVHSQHAALGEPVEPMPKCCKVLLHAGDTEREREALHVRGDERRSDGAELDAVRVAQGAEARDGAAVGFARVRVGKSRREKLERVPTRRSASGGDERRDHERHARRSTKCAAVV
jgi:hypothetical protein